MGEDGDDTVNSKDGVNGNDSLDGGAGTDTKVTDATEKSIVGVPVEGDTEGCFRSGGGPEHFGPFSRPYSPECVEGKFCELPLYGVLRRSHSRFRQMASSLAVEQVSPLRLRSGRRRGGAQRWRVFSAKIICSSSSTDGP